MFAHFSGKLIEVKPTYAVIDCMGVGYHLNISLHTFSEIKDRVECSLFAHLVVREDAQILFGFSSEKERDIFRLLISVSGLGPNTARMILSSLMAEEVVAAIVNEDVKTFTKIKGIGAKSAQRIILDLKDKVNKELKTSDFSVSMHNTSREEALSALILLGFNKLQSEKAVNKVIEVLPKDPQVEEIIKECLKLL